MQGPIKTTKQRKKVVIIGGGFAGLYAAKKLEGEDVDVIVVDRRNYHLFQPLLYQVALGVLSPGDIAQPIRGIIGESENIQVVMDEVMDLDIDAKLVKLKSGITLAYDYLCVASGASHSYFGHDNDWAPLAPGLKTIDDATEIRRRILLAFELAEREAIETGTHPHLNFAVVGGGPTGVELAGAISEIGRMFARRDFHNIDPKKISVQLYEGMDRLLSSYPEDLSKSAAKQLEDMGVQVHTGKMVEDVQPGYLMVDKERVDAVVTLWGAGVKASGLGEKLGVPVDKKGCVMVDEHLNPSGHPNVFVLGDLAHVEQDGERVPGVAQPAMQMGEQAAKMILADVQGEARKKFHYFDKGNMATIGRNAAVADIKWPFKAHWSGFFAWITWAGIHITFLIGFRNRLLVITQWLWTFLLFRASVRLITGDTSLVGWKDHERHAADRQSASTAASHS